MQAREFIDYLNYFPQFKVHFKGIYSIDNLPPRLGYRKYLICNTDVQTGEGKHWIFFGQTQKNTIELFDSLGIDEQKKKLISDYCKFEKQLIFNTTAFQDSNSASCGLFVLYFMIERLFNLDLDFEELLQLLFETDVSINEKTVLDFIQNIEKYA